MSGSGTEVSNLTAEEAFQELQKNYLTKPIIRLKRKQYNNYMNALIKIIEESSEAQYSLTIALLYPQYIPEMFNCLYNAYSRSSESSYLIALLWLDKIKYAKNVELKKLMIARHDDKIIEIGRSSPDLSGFCDDFYEDLTPEEQLGVII